MDDKTDVNLTKSNLVTVENAKKRLKSDSEFGSKIGLWLKLTCKKCCCVSHLNLCSRDPKEIVHKKCYFQYPEPYPEQYPEPYPDPKQTEFADVLDRGWDTFEKQSEEMSEYNYVFRDWWEFLMSSVLMEVSTVNYLFLEIQ